MRILFSIRWLAAVAAACALPILYAAAWLALDPRLIRFDQLEEGQTYFEGHPKLGWKEFTKVAPDVASAFRQTCSGRMHNDFVVVRGSHKVRKVENES